MLSANSTFVIPGQIWKLPGIILNQHERVLVFQAPVDPNDEIICLKCIPSKLKYGKGNIISITPNYDIDPTYSIILYFHELLSYDSTINKKTFMAIQKIRRTGNIGTSTKHIDHHFKDVHLADFQNIVQPQSGRILPKRIHKDGMKNAWSENDMRRFLDFDRFHKDSETALEYSIKESTVQKYRHLFREILYPSGVPPILIYSRRITRWENNADKQIFLDYLKLNGSLKTASKYALTEGTVKKYKREFEKALGSYVPPYERKQQAKSWKKWKLEERYEFMAFYKIYTIKAMMEKFNLSRSSVKRYVKHFAPDWKD